MTVSTDVHKGARSRMIYGLFLFIFIILLLGQYASKTGALLLDQGEAVWATGFILIGYSCLLSRGLIWIILLKYVPLSVAYPVQALSFVLIALLGVLVFQESLSLSKWLGILLIMVGVLCVARSR